jgi:hypothetical protein
MRTINRITTTFEALALIGVCDLLLSIAGGARTIKLVRRLWGITKCRTPEQAEVVLAALKDAYYRAVSIYPHRVECLPRSITLFVMARKRHIPARLHISVRKLPFASHAWVEFNGPFLANEEGLIRTLTTVLTIPSC